LKKVAGNGWLRIIVTFAAMVCLFLIADVGEVLKSIHQASPPLLAAGLALSLMTRLAAAERTFVLTRSARLHVTRRQTLAAMFIANFWSLVLPGAIGGGVATVVVYKAIGAAVEVAVAALTASRVAELVAYCAVGALTLAWSPRVPVAAQLTLSVVGVLGAALILSSRCWAVGAAGALCTSKRTGFVADVRNFIGRALSSLAAIPPGALAPSTIFAAIQCALDGASVFALAWAIGAPLSWAEATWINVAVYAAIFLPLSVGGFGLRDATVLAAFAWLGFPADEAFALSLLMFGATLLNGVIGAVVQTCAVPAKAAPGPAISP
jgi:uncharacterized membrane protein YbhN (UPF0104 family)